MVGNEYLSPSIVTFGDEGSKEVVVVFVSMKFGGPKIIGSPKSFWWGKHGERTLPELEVRTAFVAIGVKTDALGVPRIGVGGSKEVVICSVFDDVRVSDLNIFAVDHRKYPGPSILWGTLLFPRDTNSSVSASLLRNHAIQQIHDGGFAHPIPLRSMLMTPSKAKSRRHSTLIATEPPSSVGM